MHILFLTLLNIENLSESNIYTDLINALIAKGHNVTIVSPIERKENSIEEFKKLDKHNVLKVKIGNITQTKSKIEKGISTLLFEYQYLNAIKKRLINEKYDMIIYSTPPITFNKIIKFIKNRDSAKSYLMLKDIFPQNAADLNMIKNSGIIYKLFRKKEIELYNLSDTIGCMSQANIDYILEHNKFINENKVELFPNSIKIKKKEKISNFEFINIRLKYNIPENSTVFIYGGNLGKPQGIDFLINVAKKFSEVDNGYLLIVGNGTEYNKLKKEIDNNGLNNVKIFQRLDKLEYDSLISACDVGLIFLDNRFTIPNFPSRLLSYMEYSMPILAATDVNTDIGSVIVDSNSGYWVESGDLDGFITKANELSKNKNLIKEMGSNARKYLEDNYDIEKNIQKILDKIGG